MKFNRNAEKAYKKGHRIKGLKVTGVNVDYVKLLNDRHGYPYFKIRYEGKRVKVMAHRLAAFQKFGEAMYEKGIQVRHLNGNPSDFRFTNIAIGTQSQNSMDRPKEQRLASAKHAASFQKKFNYEEVRAFHKESKSYKKTMAEFGINSKGTLCRILNLQNVD